MSRLRAQSIRAMCNGVERPMIMPFSAEKLVINGKSAGLSAASYDCRINDDLVLGPDPAYLVREAILAKYDLDSFTETNKGHPDPVEHMQLFHDYEKSITTLRNAPKNYSLAHTMEDFDIPFNVSADVADKSTYARLFVSCYNTFTDPGFQGNLTLEIVNHSSEFVELKKGDPICQMIFTWLDGDTDLPYRGKYQGQSKGSHAARLENADGSYLKKEV